MFEWDEFKRILTLEARGLDFAEATAMFDGRSIMTTLARSEVEVRFLTVGPLGDDKLYAVVWTERGENKRIISLRRASSDEKRTYHSRYG